MNEDILISKMNDELSWNVGSLVRTKNFIKEKEEYTSTIVCFYPRFFKDDKDNIRYRKYLEIPLAAIKFNKDIKLIAQPDKQLLGNIVKLRLDTINRRVRDILMKVSSSYFIHFEEINFMLTPIQLIVSALVEREVLYETDIEQLEKKERIRQYLQLLQSIGLIKRDFNSWKITGEFIRLHEELKSPVKLSNTIIKLILEENYEMVYDILGIKVLAPYVNASTSYYQKAVETKSLISISVNRFKNELSEILGVSNDKAMMYIHRLIEHNLLKRENNLISGNKEIYDNIEKYKMMIMQQPSFSIGKK